MRIKRSARFVLVILGFLGGGIAIGLAIAPVSMPYSNIVSGVIGVGGIVTISGLIRNVIQDVAISNKRPYLEYGETTVRKDSHDQHGGKYTEYTYSLEIKNETENSEAENCRSTIDLSSIKRGSFYGFWDVSNKDAIPITDKASIELFKKLEFSDGMQTRTSLFFPLRTNNGRTQAEESMGSELLKKKLKISIQSSNADFPRPRIKTLQDIMDSAKEI